MATDQVSPGYAMDAKLLHENRVSSNFESARAQEPSDRPCLATTNYE